MKVSVSFLPGSSIKRESSTILGKLLTGHRRLASLVYYLSPTESKFYIQFNIMVSRPKARAKQYLYSKLYYTTKPNAAFSENQVICFQVQKCGCFEKLQIALPEQEMRRAYENHYLRFRIDGLPYVLGLTAVFGVKSVDYTVNPELTRFALLRRQRQWVREKVLESEAEKKVTLSHYPESLSLELTALCNLRCPHCSSHGRKHLHKHHNHRDEMQVKMLERLAAEAFPYASVVSLVGRGEPTLASEELWGSVKRLLVRYDIRMSCVSNGTRIKECFDEELMPYVNELCISVDGATKETFEYNRNGASFEDVMSNIRYYHELRTSTKMARRSQLSFSWTLKKNNIHELPDFVKLIKEFDPDLVSIRHMVIFQDEEREQSLLDHPYRVTNKYLKEAYALLDKYKINHESPPLMLPPDAEISRLGKKHAGDESKATASVVHTTPEVEDAICNKGETRIDGRYSTSREQICNWVHRTGIIMSDGEVITCGKHYGIRVGYLDEETSLFDIWNGSDMRSLRRGFKTGVIWAQCRDCWLREIKWHTQRQAKDNNLPFSFDCKMDYTNEAWDYRSYSEL